MSWRNRRGRSRQTQTVIKDVVIQDIFQRLKFTPPKPFLDTFNLNMVNESPATIPISFKALPNYIKSVCHVIPGHNCWQKTLLENIDIIVKGALILAEAKVCCAQGKSSIGPTRRQYDWEELNTLNIITSVGKLPYPLALYLDCIGNTSDGQRMVTPVLAEHATNPEWSGALTWAPRQLLPLLLELRAGFEQDSAVDAIRSKLQGLPKIEWEEYISESETRMIRLNEDSFNFWVLEDKIRWTNTDEWIFRQNFKFFYQTCNIAVDLLKGEGSQAQFVHTSEWQVDEHIEWFVMTAVDDRCVQLGTAFRFGATRSEANNILTGPKENAYMLGYFNPTPIFNKIFSFYETITGSMRTHPNPDAFGTREVAKLMAECLVPSTLKPLSVNVPVKIPVSFTGLPGFINEVWKTMKILRSDTHQTFWTIDKKDVFIKAALILSEAKVCCAQKQCYFSANVSQDYTWDELIMLNQLADMKLPYPLAMYLECLGNTRDRSREVTPVLAEHATNREWSGALTWAPRQLLPLLLQLRSGIELDSAVDAIRSKLHGLPKIEWEEYNSEHGTRMVRLSEDSFNFWVMEDTRYPDVARYKIRWTQTDISLFSSCISYLNYYKVDGFNIMPCHHVNLLRGLGSPAQFVQLQWEAGEPVAWFAMTEVDDVSALLGAAFRFSTAEPIANRSVLNGTRANAYMYSCIFNEFSTVNNILSWAWDMRRYDDGSDSSDQRVLAPERRGASPGVARQEDAAQARRARPRRAARRRRGGALAASGTTT